MKKYCFGVDVGGTTVKVGLFTVEGQLLDKWEIITRTENNGENILFDICESLEAKLDEKSIDLDEVKGIGIGLPGPVLDDGTVLQCVNLGWLRQAMMPTLQLLVKRGKVAERILMISLWLHLEQV